MNEIRFSLAFIENFNSTSSFTNIRSDNEIFSYIFRSGVVNLFNSN
jgi:hypothetical protein